MSHLSLLGVGPSGAGAAPFTPADLALTLNMESDSLSSPPVSSWTGPGSVTGTQSTAANQPTWQATTGPRGGPAVYFDGGDYLNLDGGLSYAGDFTLYLVVKTCPPGPSTKVVLGDGVGTACFADLSDDSLYIKPTGGSFIQSAHIPQNRWHLLRMQRSGTTWTVHVNGLLYATATVGAGTLPLTMLGSWDGTASNGFLGWVAAAFGKAAVISGADDTAMLTYIRNKYHTPGPESYTWVDAGPAEAPSYVALSASELFAAYFSLGSPNLFETARSTDGGLTFALELSESLNHGTNVFHDLGMTRLLNGNLFIPSCDTGPGIQYVLWQVSTDGGHTISVPFNVVTPPAGKGNLGQPYGRAFELNGVVYWPVYWNSSTPHTGNPSNDDSMLFKTATPVTGASTFTVHGTIGAAGTPDDTSSYNETTVVVWTDLIWFAVMRYSHGPDGADPATMRFSSSTDGGVTWITPVSMLNDELGVSPCMIKTQSGKILLLYGSRQVNGYDAGIRARLGTVSGTTITWADYFKLHERFVNNDTGYPDVLESSAGVFDAFFYDEQNRIVFKRFYESDLPTTVGLGTGLLIDRPPTTGWGGSEADGTALASHVMDTGPGYVTPLGTFEVRAGRINCTAVTGGEGLFISNAGTASVSTVKLKVPSASFNVGVVGWSAVDGTGWYMAYMVLNANKVRLFLRGTGFLAGDLITPLYDGMDIGLEYDRVGFMIRVLASTLGGEIKYGPWVSTGGALTNTYFGGYHEGASRTFQNLRVVA